MEHVPVMIREVAEHLIIREGECVIDATAGAGGYTRMLLERVGPRGKVLAVETDPDAVHHLRTLFQPECASGNVVVVHGNFGYLEAILTHEFPFTIAAAVFDLGTSSDQLRARGRGFSFEDDDSFDMRLSKGVRGPYLPELEPAVDMVNRLSENELGALLRRFGDERESIRFARAIVAARNQAPITTSKAFSQVLWNASPRIRRSRIPARNTFASYAVHPATKALQALRIAVNRELVFLEQGLAAAFAQLRDGGRICAVTFHSGEDRIVKRRFRAWAEEGIATAITPRPIAVSGEEIAKNIRSRSAKLRTIEKNQSTLSFV